MTVHAKFRENFKRIERESLLNHLQKDGNRSKGWRNPYPTAPHGRDQIFVNDTSCHNGHGPLCPSFTMPVSSNVELSTKPRSRYRDAHPLGVAAFNEGRFKY